MARYVHTIILLCGICLSAWAENESWLTKYPMSTTLMLNAGNNNGGNPTAEDVDFEEVK